MNHVFQKFIEALSNNPDTTVLRGAMEEAAAAFDLRSFAYLVARRGCNGSARLISNYPAQWTDHYLANGYDRCDPVITRVQRYPESFQWGDGLWSQPLLACENQLMDEADMFGIRCGFSFPIHDTNNRIAAVTFAADQYPPAFRRCYEKHHQVLHLLAILFHAEASRALAPKREVMGILLSQREFECLAWAARGKSAWDTAQIIGISGRTIRFHLENAKSKLGVKTIPQAVALLAASKRREC